jgi:hypothetical protein
MYNLRLADHGKLVGWSLLLFECVGFPFVVLHDGFQVGGAVTAVSELDGHARIPSMGQRGGLARWGLPRVMQQVFMS